MREFNILLSGIALGMGLCGLLVFWCISRWPPRGPMGPA